MFRNKLFRLAMLGLFVMVVLSSAFLPALENGHLCSGDDCPVCWCINICRNTLKNSALPCVIACFAVTAGAVFRISVAQGKFALRSDLVALSVKLSR
ncbi:MAG: hypothetical protein IJP54_00920 [Synergistaceae bacterium]|nr:hypothetical protein [Synergistaceae bacterium]MBR0034213.1 hypothetical protein [Synergistaceae bacterium]